MLPEHSQQLLRAARSGRLLKPPAPSEDDNEMKDEEEEIKEVQSGFVVRKYIKVPRHLEVSEPEYLAKRRKGLPSPYSMNGAVQPALRETKVKKLDAEGNATVYKVLVPEGQAVEGEVQPTDAAIEVAPATAAPGTIVEGVGIVNAEGVVVANDLLQQTPPRRRPPPPKKKMKRAGPGRGKKKVVFVEGAAELGSQTSNTGNDTLPVPGIKHEAGSVEPSDGDTPMAEAGGEDDEVSGDEGSDDDEHDTEHTSNPATPATPSRPVAAPTSVPNLDDTEMSTLEIAASAAPLSAVVRETSQPIVERKSLTPPTSALETTEHGAGPDPSSSPDLPLSAVSHSRQNSLNQVLTSTITEPELMSLEPLDPLTISTSGLEQIVVPGSEITAAVEVVPAPSTDLPSATPSEPDLMGSLERHLEKDSKDIAGS
jgi:hypothetical protein